MEKFINSGNYNYNYAYSFYGKDFKNVNIKVIRGRKDAHFSKKPQVSSSIESPKKLSNFFLHIPACILKK